MITKEMVCGFVLLYFFGAALTVVALATCDYCKVSVYATSSDVAEFFWLSLVWPVVVLVVGIRFTIYRLICAGCALRRIFVKDKKGDKE